MKQPNAEQQFLEGILMSRIDQFKYHEWKKDSVGYVTDYCLATGDVYAEGFCVQSVTEKRTAEDR